MNRTTRIHRSRADREALSSYVELSAQADRRRIDRAQVDAFEHLTPAQLDVLVADLIDGTQTAAIPPRRSILRRMVGSEAGFAVALLAATALAGALTLGTVGAVALATGGAGTSAASESSGATASHLWGDTPGGDLDF